MPVKELYDVLSVRTSKAQAGLMSQVKEVTSDDPGAGILHRANISLLPLWQFCFRDLAAASVDLTHGARCRWKMDYGLGLLPSWSI